MGISLSGLTESSTGNLTLSAGSGNDVLIGNGSTQIFIDGGTDTLGIGGAAVSGSRFNIETGAVALDFITSTGTALNVIADTVNDTSGAATLAIVPTVQIGVMTYTSTNSMTYTDTASLYIAGIPAASTNVTFTNAAYALWVDAGAVRFDDRTFWIGGIAYEFPADNGNANEMLLTDGSGNLSWSSVASASAATTVTVTDNEDTNESNLITFVAGAATSTGNYGLEMDGDFHYSPNTGTVAATNFSLTDNGKVQLGTGNDSTLYYDGTDTFLNLRAVGTGDLMIALAGSFPSPDPNGVHIWRGDAGSITGNANAILTLEHSGDAYMQFLGSATSTQRILFGDPGSNEAGQFIYDHQNVRFEFRIETGSRLRYSVGAFAFQEATTISTSSGNLTLSAATGADVLIGDNATILFVDGGNGHIGLGSAADPHQQVDVNFPAETVTVDMGFDRFFIDNGNAITTAASGTHARISSLHIDEPNITIGTAGVTDAVTLYIQRAPSEGTNNYALHVAAGTSRFDGNLKVALADGSNFNDYALLVQNDDQTAGQGHGFRVSGSRAVSSSDVIFRVGSYADSDRDITVLGDGAITIANGGGTVNFGGNVILAGSGNTDTTLDIQAPGTGDPKITFTGAGTSIDWYMGVDNTDESFKIGTGTTVGSNTLFDIDPTTSGVASKTFAKIDPNGLTTTNDAAGFYTGLLLSSMTWTFTTGGVTGVTTANKGYFEISRPDVTLSSSVSTTIDQLNGIVVTAPRGVHSNLTVAAVAGIRILDNGFTTGTQTVQYGLYVNSLTSGSTEYAVYTAGSTPSYFGGKVGIGEPSPDRSVHITSSGIDGFRYERNNQYGWELVDDDADGEIRFQVSAAATNTGPVEASTVWATHDNKALGSLVLQLMPDGGSSSFGGDVSLANGGGLVVGHTAQVVVGDDAKPEFQVLGTGLADSSMVLGRFQDFLGNEANFNFLKSKAAIGGSGIVSDDDQLGKFQWHADDGNDYNTRVASFGVEVDDASPEENGVGAAFVWKQQLAGSTALPRETMRLSTAGALSLSGESGSGLLNVGASGNDWTQNALSLAGGSAAQLMTIETTGSSAALDLYFTIPASGTGQAGVTWKQGSGNGDANNMAYQMWYAPPSGQWGMWSADIDGSSTGGNILGILDGTNDWKMYGGLSTDGLTAPTTGILTSQVDINNGSLLNVGASGDGWTANTITIDSGGADFVIAQNGGSALEIKDSAGTLLNLDTRPGTKNTSYWTFDGPASNVSSNGNQISKHMVATDPYTYTLQGTTTVSVEWKGLMLFLQAPTIAQSGGAVTVTTASSFHVTAITAGSSVTITNNRMISTSVSDCYLTAAGVWTDTSSTQKVKDNILDLPLHQVGGLIRQIRPRTYTYKDHMEDFGRTRYGAVAEEFPDFLRVPGDASNSAVNATVLANFALVGNVYLMDRVDEHEKHMDAQYDEHESRFGDKIRKLEALLKKMLGEKEYTLLMDTID
ncbi:hypothetical protein [uncultured virus]|uniref:Peptidase S74 domain-containing protein n=1 Tax=uncultured virus TaxID=340016 RepID=A0A218MKY2_9VIRU|nr:hypothetical protein [uncultured virus]